MKITKIAKCESIAKSSEKLGFSNITKKFKNWFAEQTFFLPHPNREKFETPKRLAAQTSVGLVIMTAVITWCRSVPVLHTLKKPRSLLKIQHFFAFSLWKCWKSRGHSQP
jgi:hypothetical protein